MRSTHLFFCAVIPWSALLALGCSPVVDQRTTTVPVISSQTIIVNNPHGTVRVQHTAPEGTLRVSAQVAALDQERLATSHVIIETSAEHTQIFVAWAKGAPMLGESVDLVVEVPRWRGVVVQTEDGPLQVVGLEPELAWDDPFALRAD